MVISYCDGYVSTDFVIRYISIQVYFLLFLRITPEVCAVLWSNSKQIPGGTLVEPWEGCPKDLSLTLQWQSTAQSAQNATTRGCVWLPRWAPCGGSVR